MNTDHTLMILDQLFSCYPNTKIEPATVGMYVRLLSDIPADDLQTVVDQVIATGKFLPTIAEIRDTWHNLHNADRLTAGDAWDAVQKEIRRIGYLQAPRFSDELTARVVESMGWRVLCASETVMADRAHFMKMYDDLARRQESNQKLLPQARELAERNSAANELVEIRKLLGVIGK